MASMIEFHGIGPFDLPIAQSSRAAAGSDAVTLTFSLVIDTSRARNRPELVRIAVPNNQARELAAAILAAVPKKD